MNIIIAGICKNEITLIESYVKSALLEADSLVILDTGSTDGTYEKLQTLAETDPRLSVYQEFFTNIDFSKFRNALQEKLCNHAYDFVLHLDADERLVSGWRTAIEKKAAPRMTIRRNEADGFRTSLLRIFSNHNGEWRNAVHEGFYSHNSDIMNAPPVDSTISVNHYSSKSTAKDSLYRELLIKDNHDHGIYYQLLEMHVGKEYSKFLDHYSISLVSHLPEEFQHLLSRYAIVANVNVNRCIPRQLVDRYLAVDDLNTRFMLARYFHMCGDDNEARIHFHEFVARRSKGVDVPSAYMPQAHDMLEIEKISEKLKCDRTSHYRDDCA